MQSMAARETQSDSQAEVKRLLRAQEQAEQEEEEDHSFR